MMQNLEEFLAVGDRLAEQASVIGVQNPVDNSLCATHGAVRKSALLRWCSGLVFFHSNAMPNPLGN